MVPRNTRATPLQDSRAHSDTYVRDQTGFKPGVSHGAIRLGRKSPKHVATLSSHPSFATPRHIMLTQPPTYHGCVPSLVDAHILMIAATSLHRLPSASSRLSHQQTIRSGDIFVWSEAETGIRRWTDGCTWSASRACGAWMAYVETNGSGRGAAPKQGGLLKRTIVLTRSTDGDRIHLVSYFHPEDIRAGRLLAPSADPCLSDVCVPPGFLVAEVTEDEAPSHLPHGRMRRPSKRARNSATPMPTSAKDAFDVKAGRRPSKPTAISIPGHNRMNALSISKKNMIPSPMSTGMITPPLGSDSPSPSRLLWPESTLPTDANVIDWLPCPFPTPVMLPMPSFPGISLKACLPSEANPCYRASEDQRVTDVLYRALAL